MNFQCEETIRTIRCENHIALEMRCDRFSLRRFFVAFLFLITVCGCSEAPDQTVEQTAVVMPPKLLNVLFVDSTEVADEVARRWTADRNGELAISSVSADEYLANDYAASEQHDVVIYPARLLGQLSADDQVIPLPDEVWNSEELDNRGLLRDSRTTLIRFGDQRWAVPLGSPGLRMMLRKDVLDALELQVPKTWPDFVQLIEKLSSSKPVDEDGNALPVDLYFPTDGQYAAYSLLAISASTVRHRGKLNSVFNRQTMEPLIAEPPYAEALATLREVTSRAKGSTVEQAVSKFFQGEAAVVVGWPTAAFGDEAEVSDATLDNCIVARLPGSRRWYDFSSSRWQPNDDGVAQVELTGFTAIQASLLTSNRHPTTAYDFLSWLGSKKVAISVFSKCPNSSPTRASHLGNTQSWTGELLSVENNDIYADQITQINEQPVFLMFPRINGIEEYLASLSEGVRSYLNEEATDPNAVLRKVADQWNVMTEKYDRNQQEKLLRMDFGL